LPNCTGPVAITLLSAAPPNFGRGGGTAKHKTAFDKGRRCIIPKVSFSGGLYIAVFVKANKDTVMQQLIVKLGFAAIKIAFKMPVKMETKLKFYSAVKKRLKKVL
jgi:hypothetical protein